MAQEAGITAKLHPWGQFDPGTWKTVRVTTETFNEQGQVVSTSTADATTTLVDIDNDGVTLEIQTCMEVAGKRFEAEPQTVKQGFHGELALPEPETDAAGRRPDYDRRPEDSLQSAGHNGSRPAPAAQR